VVYRPLKHTGSGSAEAARDRRDVLGERVDADRLPLVDDLVDDTVVDRLLRVQVEAAIRVGTQPLL